MLVITRGYTGWWCNNHLEKYDFVNGKDGIPYEMENNPFMSETSNQIIILEERRM